MATLIAKLPSLGAPGSSNTGHQRIESAPPSPLAEEADLANLPSGSAEDDAAGMGTKKQWKGKGIDPAERRGSMSPPPAGASPNEEEEEERGATVPGKPTESYPPMNDEEVETRKVQENLRRWEELEKQRRKAARDSRNARTPSTLISDVTGYVTSFGGRPASRRKDSRTDSVGTIPHIPEGTPTRPGGWTAARTRDSDDVVELEDSNSKNEQQVPPTNKKKKGVANRQSLASIASTETNSTVTSGPKNPFSTPAGTITSKPSEERDEPFTPPTHLVSRESSTSSEDPFKNPEATKTDLDLPLLSTPTNLSPATSPRVDKGMLLQVPRSPRSSAGKDKVKDKDAAAKRTSVKQPAPQVQPLDLPEPKMPRMEPEPGSGHWRRVQDAKRRDEEFHEELDQDAARGGRWWTDWMCGCREGHVREEQAGRTNPFE